MMRGYIQGVAMHETFLSMSEGDSKRDKRRCKFFSNNGQCCKCGFNCPGASHCDYYIECTKSELQNRKQEAKEEKKKQILEENSPSAPSNIKRFMNRAEVNDPRAIQQELTFYYYGNDFGYKRIYALNDNKYKEIYVKGIRIVSKFDNQNLYYAIKNRRNVLIKQEKCSCLKVEQHKVFVRIK